MSEPKFIKEFDEYYNREFRQQMEAETRSHQSAEENIAKAGWFADPAFKERMSFSWDDAWKG